MRLLVDAHSVVFTYALFSIFQNYCYTANCDREGCLDDMIGYITSNNYGAYCKADENGCQVFKQRADCKQDV